MHHSWAPAVAGWLTHLAARGVADSSIKAYRQRIGHAGRRLGPLSALTADDLAGYLAQQNWETETRRGRLTSLRDFLDHAGLDELAAALPVGKAGVPNPRPVPDRVYLAALALANEDEAIWIDLAAEHGLRRGEMAALRVDSLVELLDGPGLHFRGKGGKWRTVPLTPAMADVLTRLARARRAVDGDRAFLWPGDEAGHVSARWLGRRVNRLLEGAWTIHKLRHRAATRFYRVSGDVYTVAELMGWSNLNVARRYIPADPDRLRSTVLAASRAPQG